MRKGLCLLTVCVLLYLTIIPAAAGGHWVLAFWRSLCQEEAANNLFIRVWTFDENGQPVGNVPITSPTGTVYATTDATGRVDFPMSVSNEYQCKVGQAGTTSELSPYMSIGRYPNWGHYSYELGFMYKSDINNPGTFDTTLVCGPEPRLGSTTSNAPCTQSLAYLTADPCNWSCDVGARVLPDGGWGEHGQTFVPNGNRVVCVQFHPTVGGINQVIQFTVEIYATSGGLPVGPPIATKTSSAHYNQDWWVVPFGTSACPVTPGQTYFARVYRSGGFNAYYMQRDFSPAGGYSTGRAVGQAYWRPNSSSPWSPAPSPCVDLKGFVCCATAMQTVSITNVSVTPSTGSAVITWTTNVPATSRVDYGTTSSYGKYVFDSTLTTTHSITITGLHGNEIYHYKLTSTAPSYADGQTGDATFITLSANPNMLVNPGFETGSLSPWRQSSSIFEIGGWCTWGCCPRSGSKDVVSAASYGQKDGYLYQVVNGAVPGATYTATAWIWTRQVGGADSDVAVRLGIHPSGLLDPATTVWTPEYSSQESWMPISVSAQATGTSLTFVFEQIHKWNLQWNINGYDDCTLTGPIGGNVPAVKGYVDGAQVALSNVIVTATASQIGAYYVQEPNRTSGIRVEAVSGSASLNQKVNVVGWLTTVNGERVIIDATITPTGSGTAKPLAMNNRDIAGGDFNSVAKGASGKYGTNNVGLLIKTFGKVSSPGGGVFYVTDGSGSAVKVDASSVGSLPAVNDYVAVTGICRLEKVGGNYVPVIKLRQAGDWRKMN